MQGPDPSAWFVGDLDDPWVAAIADALPPGVSRLCCGMDLPDAWPSGIEQARALILHRATLTNADADRLQRLQPKSEPSPRVVLCVGPYARHHHWNRWGPLVDVVLPEATASETIARHLTGVDRLGPPGGGRPLVSVVVGNHEIRRALVDACQWAGYAVEPARDWSEATSGGLAIWDVPVLDEDWPELMARQSRGRSVVALLGFADRATVGLARARGAAACLDMPCELTDLVYVLDRLAVGQAGRSAESGHALPPFPAVLRRMGRSPHRGDRESIHSAVADPGSIA